MPIAANQFALLAQKAIEDMQTLGKGHPTNLKFYTSYYADAGKSRAIECWGLV